MQVYWGSSLVNQFGKIGSTWISYETSLYDLQLLGGYNYWEIVNINSIVIPFLSTPEKSPYP